MAGIWWIFIGVCFIWFCLILATTPNEIRKNAKIPKKKKFIYRTQYNTTIVEKYKINPKYERVYVSATVLMGKIAFIFDCKKEHQEAFKNGLKRFNVYPIFI